MKKTLLTLILFLPCIYCCQNVKNTCTTITYTVGGNKVEVKSIILKNNEIEPLVLWLSKNNKEEYHSYFKKKGDFSILDLLNDDNFSDYTIDVYSTFLKILQPGEAFTIIFNEDKPYINKIALSQLPRYIKESIIRTNIRDSYKFYQPNFIVLK